MVKDVSMVLDIPIHRGTLASTAQLLLEWINEGRMQQHVVTANSEILYRTKHDMALRNILQRAALVTADGMGVVWAANMLGDPLPERVTGYDLMHTLLALLNEQERSVYLLGAKPEILPAAVFEIKRLYPTIIIKGFHHGYFDEVSESEILTEINNYEPDLLLVGLGSPRQEYWLRRNLPNLSVKVAMGIGGSFDVLAGVIERAPEDWQKRGMEWAYRLLKEPRRIGRMTALPKFALRVLLERITNRH